MERLTNRNLPMNGYLSNSKELRDYLDRMAAYEDTGLSPEDCATYKKFEDNLCASGVPFSRIIELVNAEKAKIAALRPITREQVEKVWRGEWIGDDDEKVGIIDGSPMKSATCSACGNWLVGSDEYDCSGYFCPACGRAMTDEAVQMVMERLEALKDGTME